MALYPAIGTESNAANISIDRMFWLALVFSLALHIALYYVLPYLQNSQAQPIKRVIVELNMLEQQQAAPAPAPSPPVVETKPVEPKPQQVVKEQVKPQKPIEKTPVLTTDVPVAHSDYIAPATPSPVAATAAPVDESKPSTSTATGHMDTTPTQQAPTTEASKDEAWDGYGQALYEMVGKNKNYPQIAIRRNWEGQAKVLAKFILGKLVEVTLIDSSGHEVLDNEALAMLRKAVSQLPVRGNLANKTFTVTVPVDFKLMQEPG